MVDATNPADPPPSTVERDRGDGGQFQARAGGQVLCLTCRQSTPASEIHAESPSRLEGVSDPDDMLLVVSVVCPVCGTAGSMTLGYGPVSSSEDAEVLSDLHVST